MRLGAALFGCLAAATAHPAPAAAQSYAAPALEQPAETLAENVKILATKPRDFNALIAAGKAALALGDAQAAAGFFGRAEEVWPANSQPQIGKGAALAQEGDAAGAMHFFARAVTLGATQSMVGAERGLAHDLLGQHAQAQADYRAALVGPETNEARRRLALSLAITGNRAEALSLLGPLMARGDAAAARTRAFVLALTGDTAGARASIEAAMPGSSMRMEYFFQKLPMLRSDQKAAAVHLGIFPDASQLAALAPSYSLPQSTTQPGAQAPGGIRIGSVGELLSQGAPSSTQPPIARQPAPQARPSVPAASQPNQPAGQVYSSRRVWLQLASGSNAEALPDQFQRIKARNSEFFRDIDGYLVDEARQTRLLIGPFRSAREADIFAQDLSALRVDASRWVNPPGQIIRKLP